MAETTPFTVVLESLKLNLYIPTASGIMILSILSVWDLKNFEAFGAGIQVFEGDRMKKCRKRLSVLGVLSWGAALSILSVSCSRSKSPAEPFVQPLASASSGQVS